MIDDLDKIVKTEKNLEWPEMKKKWFVTNFNDARDLRYPGRMKIEWETSCGSIIA
jgi:hypothetical protein